MDRPSPEERERPSLSGLGSMPDNYVTMTELCARLSICRRTVANHHLTRFALRVGSQWRFKWADVVAHYARQAKDAQR